MFKKLKKQKLKNNIRGLIIFFLIIIVYGLIYIISNFRKFNTILLNGNNNSFFITNAIMIYNPDFNLIKIDNIKYNDDDFLIENISLELSAKSNYKEIIKTIDYASQDPISIKDYFNKLKINIPNKLTNRIIYDSNIIFLLKINIFTADKRFLSTEIILNQDRSTNDHLLYF